MLNNEYCKRVYEQILARDPDQKEFHQAVYEVLEGLEPMVERRPELEKNGILERFVEPGVLSPSGCPGLTMPVWSMSTVATGYSSTPPSAPTRRSAVPPTVNLSILKFLGFEQV